MDREQLKEILPHREPMLLLDSSEVIDGIACGTYKVRGDEFFLQGHLPGNPVVPGVILCEMMAQGAAVLLAGQENMAGATPMFTSLDKVRFKNPVKPGDTLESESSIIKSKGPFYWCAAKGYVAGKLCVTAEFSFALVK